MTEQVMPEIDHEQCTQCGDCIAACPTGALSMSPAGRIAFDGDTCRYCGDCEDICPMGAIALPFDIVLASDDQAGE
jgi:ferredoxin